MEGKVIDAHTKQPLAFVNVGIADTQHGTSTDIDGKFKLTSSQPFSEIIFSYVGYEEIKYIVWNEKYLAIKMNKKTIELSEVEVKPTENPANPIIRKVSKNRDKNNPEKIQTYVCNT